jgi:hypothetical protein
MTARYCPGGAEFCPEKGPQAQSAAAMEAPKSLRWRRPLMQPGKNGVESACHDMTKNVNGGAKSLTMMGN